jgi:hypothetical protein
MRFRPIVTLGALGAAALLVSPAAAQTTTTNGCLEAPLSAMADSGVTGSGQLCMEADGIHVDLSTEHLTSDSVYTTWFVYFDRPSTCQSNPCDDPDLVGDNPPGVLGRMDSTIADASGTAHFSGEIHGMRLSHGSEFQLPLFVHGAVNRDDNRALARQLLTPQVAALGAPGLGVKADGDRGSPAAMAIFEIP